MDCNVFFVEFSQLFSVSSSFDGVRLTFTGFLRGRVILGFEGVLLGLRRAIDATAGDKSVFRGLRHGRYFRWRPASPPKLDAAAEADDSQKKKPSNFLRSNRVGLRFESWHAQKPWHKKILRKIKVRRRRGFTCGGVDAADDGAQAEQEAPNGRRVRHDADPKRRHVVPESQKRKRKQKKRNDNKNQRTTVTGGWFLLEIDAGNAVRAVAVVDGARLIAHAVLPRVQRAVQARRRRRQRLDLGRHGADEVLVQHRTCLRPLKKKATVNPRKKNFKKRRRKNRRGTSVGEDLVALERLHQSGVAGVVVLEGEAVDAVRVVEVGVVGHHRQVGVGAHRQRQHLRSPPIGQFRHAPSFQKKNGTLI